MHLLTVCMASAEKAYLSVEEARRKKGNVVYIYL